MNKIIDVTIGGLVFAVRCLTEEQFGTVMASEGKKTIRGDTVEKCKEVEESGIAGDDPILEYEAFMAFFPQ